jgi:ElaB/YqjD/DUF883 family membrane-anchored ribosome-binding protein
MCLVESELLLARNKNLNLEASNKQVHAELAKLREELMSAQDAKKTADDALVTLEAKHQEQIKAVNKKLNDNLEAIAASIKSFTVSIFGKLTQNHPCLICCVMTKLTRVGLCAGAKPPEAKMIACDRMHALKTYCPKLKEACTLVLTAILEEGLLEKMYKVPQYFSR